jgi:histidinol dehydrogenase
VSWSARAYAAAALGTNGGCILVSGPDEAAEVANAFAPEHLQLSVSAALEPELLAELRNAGEILLGQQTPFSAGNFVIGAPAALPTNGWAKVSSGITVDTFVKRTAVARADQRALARMTPTVLALSAHEGFPAHANAVTARRL